MLCPSDEGITAIDSAFGSWLRVVDTGLSVEHSLPPGLVLETTRTSHISRQKMAANSFCAVGNVLKTLQGHEVTGASGGVHKMENYVSKTYFKQRSDIKGNRNKPTQEDKTLTN